MFERLAKNQTRVERWCETSNDSSSLWNGLIGINMTVWIFAFLAFAALQTGWRSIVLIVFAVLFFCFAIQYLHGVTLQNRTFMRLQRRLLNDARLVPVVAQTFSQVGMFEHWLDRHEASAARVFGVRVTTKRMAEAVGVFGSVLAILATVIVQKQVGV